MAIATAAVDRSTSLRPPSIAKPRAAQRSTAMAALKAERPPIYSD